MTRICLALALLMAGITPVMADGPPTPGQAQIVGTKNGSVTITTGNTFQTVLAALTAVSFPGRPSRRSLTIQNNNTTTDNCWIFIGSGTASAATSILLQPGQAYTRYWPYVPSDAIQGTCASNSDTLYVDTQ